MKLQFKREYFHLFIWLKWCLSDEQSPLLPSNLIGKHITEHCLMYQWRSLFTHPTYQTAFFYPKQKKSNWPKKLPKNVTPTKPRQSTHICTRGLKMYIKKQIDIEKFSIHKNTLVPSPYSLQIQALFQHVHKLFNLGPFLLSNINLKTL